MDDTSSKPKPWGIDFDALIERYMKELNVPHSRKGPIIEPGVVPTGCLRVGSLEEGMNLVPVEGYFTNVRKRKLVIEKAHSSGATAGHLNAQLTYDVPCTKVMSSRETLIEVCDKNFTAKRIKDNTTPKGSMTISSHKGDSVIDAKSMSESLLKAKEKVYPVSRLDIITKLKGMNKKRDAKLNEFDTDRARIVYMVNNYVEPFFEQRVVETVAFAKLIPGFRELPLVDQISLVRDSKFECSSILGHYYDFATGIFYADDGTPLNTMDLELVMGFQEIVIKRLEFTLFVESLTLTPLEESVIRALTIIKPVKNGSKLVEQEKALAIYEHLTRCLSYVISIYHSDPAFRAEQMNTLLKKCSETDKLSENLLRVHAKKEWPATFLGSVANEVLHFEPKQ